MVEEVPKKTPSYIAKRYDSIMLNVLVWNVMQLLKFRPIIIDMGLSVNDALTIIDHLLGKVVITLKLGSTLYMESHWPEWSQSEFLCAKKPDSMSVIFVCKKVRLHVRHARHVWLSSTHENKHLAEYVNKQATRTRLKFLSKNWFGSLP